MNLNDLPNVLLRECISFLGEENCLFVAGARQSFQDGCASLLYQILTETHLTETVTFVSQVTMALEQLNYGGNEIDRQKWRGRNVNPWKAVIECAAWIGHIEVIAWSKANKESQWDAKVPRARHHNLKCDACDEAAHGGNLDDLAWAHKRNCSWNQ